MVIPRQNYGMSPSIWDHCVTCYPTQVNATRLNPSPQVDTRFIYHRGMAGCDDLGYPAMERLGVELETSRSQVRRPNHYTTEPPNTCYTWSWSVSITRHYITCPHFHVIQIIKMNSENINKTALDSNLRTLKRQKHTLHSQHTWDLEPEWSPIVTKVVVVVLDVITILKCLRLC